MVAQQLREKAHIGLGGGNFTPLGRGFSDCFEHLQGGHGELLIGFGAPVRQIPAQGFAALVQILHLGRVIRWFVKRQLGQLAVGNRNVETIAKGFDVFVGQLLGLVHRVFAFTGAAHAKTFDGLDQQHRRLAFVFHCSGISGIHLLRIVAATTQIPNIVIAHLGHHLQGLRVTAKEMFAHISAIVGLEGLVIAVQGVHHDAAQGTVFVTRNQRVPIAAPNQLDDVPTRASEFTFQLLDDLAVATHWAIQTLQVAVDDEHQVVEFFTRGQTNRAQRFHLVHFTVTTKHPDLAVLGVGDATGMQVFQKTRLVNGHQGAQAHGHRGELPKLGHEFGVRIAGQTFAVHLLAEIQQLFFGQAAFQIRTGINARRHMALDVEQVAAVVFVLCMPKMIEARTEHVGQRSEGANVPPQVAAISGVVSVGFHHHGHRVPAHVGTQTFFDFNVARAAFFLIGFDGVDITRVGRERHVDAVFAGMF